MLMSKRRLPCISQITSLKEFNNYNQIQQFNCFKIKNHQQDLTDQQSLIYKKDHHSIASSTDDHHQYLRFNHPYKKFIHHHKIIHKNKTKKAIKHHQRNQALKIMKKMPNSYSKPIHEDPFKTKQHTIQLIFEWMMEFASLLKITKNAYFRSILILQRAIQADSRIIANNRIAEYACAALSIGCKFQCSRRNYLSDIFITYSRRISKNEIINAQNGLLTAIRWCIPVQVLLQQELFEVLKLWAQYLKGNKGQFEKNLYLKCYYNDIQNRIMSKFYIEIVYILDFLIIKRNQEWLKEDAFTEPILITLYILFSINMGDVHLDQNCLWPHFQRFIIQKNLFMDTNHIKNQINRCFIEYRIIQVLGQIPLNLNFEKIIRKKSQQFYIPKIN